MVKEGFLEMGCLNGGLENWWDYLDEKEETAFQAKQHVQRGRVRNAVKKWQPNQGN